MGIIMGGLAAAAICLFIWGEIMRAHLPRLDLFLATAAASPIATEGLVVAAGITAAGTSPGVRFFSTPIFEFTWSGVPAFLTAPDILALVSSLILLVRFFAWAVAPLVDVRNRRDGGQ